MIVTNDALECRYIMILCLFLFVLWLCFAVDQQNLILKFNPWTAINIKPNGILSAYFTPISVWMHSLIDPICWGYVYYMASNVNHFAIIVKWKNKMIVATNLLLKMHMKCVTWIFAQLWRSKSIRKQFKIDYLAKMLFTQKAFFIEILLELLFIYAIALRRRINYFRNHFVFCNSIKIDLSHKCLLL